MEFKRTGHPVQTHLSQESPGFHISSTLTYCILKDWRVTTFSSQSNNKKTRLVGYNNLLEPSDSRNPFQMLLYCIFQIQCPSFVKEQRRTYQPKDFQNLRICENYS